MYVARLAKHGILFSLAKSAVLVAPLFAASVLDEIHYGKLEFWIALAVVLGVAISFGSGIIIAYESLKNKESGRVHTAGSYVIVLLLTCLIISGATWQVNTDISIIVLLSALVVAQTVLAARLKGEGLGAWASISESSLYICILISVFLTLYGGNFFSWFQHILVIFVIFVSVIFIIRLNLFSQFVWEKNDYYSFARVGFHFMLASLLTILFLNIPRIFLGYVEGAVATAQFSLSFRWVALAIVFHQFSVTYYFRTFFSGSDKKIIDSRISVVIFLVFFIAMVIALVINHGFLAESKLPMPKLSEFEVEYMLASAIGIWSASACLEGVLYKNGYQGVQLMATFFGLLFFVFAVLVLRDIYEPVKAVTIAWMGGFAIIFCFQWLVLHIRGLTFSYIAVAGIFILVIGFCLIYAQKDIAGI